MTQPNLPPVSDAEAQEWARLLECVYQVTVNGEVKIAMFDCQDAARRLLADRARDKERIYSLEQVNDWLEAEVNHRKDNALLVARLEAALALTPENVDCLKTQMQEARDRGDVGKVYTIEAQRILAHLRRAAGLEEATNAP